MYVTVQRPAAQQGISFNLFKAVRTDMNLGGREPHQMRRSYPSSLPRCPTSLGECRSAFSYQLEFDVIQKSLSSCYLGRGIFQRSMRLCPYHP